MLDTILVIEDNIELLNTLKNTLLYYDFDVLPVSNGVDALSAINNDNISLIICDINLPDISGYDILHAVRNDKKHYWLPFIFLTAYTAENDKVKGMDEGADDYITKPFENKRLVQTIESRIALSKRTRLYVQNEIDSNWIEVINHNFKQEFLTPLNSIINATYLLETVPNDSTLFDFKETINAIYVSSFRIFRNTRNLITFSIIQHGNIIRSSYLSRENIIVHDLILEIIEYYNNGITNNWNLIKPYLDYVTISSLYKDFFNIIFTELIDNGVRHDSKKMPPIISLIQTDNGFEFTVINNIDENRNLDIFLIKPFYKFHEDGTLNGLGLGLFICKSLCKSLGLSFKIKKEPDRISFSVVYENKI